MEFTSSTFLLFVLVTALAFNAASSVPWRNAVLGAASLWFLVSFVRTPLQLAPLAAFLVLGFAATRWVARWPRGWVLGTTLAVIVVVFVVLKRYTFVPAAGLLPFSYLDVGLSYVLFRVLQMVIDSASGDGQARLSPFHFFNFTCNFLCFVSGPIQRSSDYLSDQAHLARRLDDRAARAALQRIVRGYVKLAVVSAIADYLFANLSGPVLDGRGTLAGARFAAQYAATAVAYTYYLYYNFAGYMDIVIGVGWLVGQDLPENFDRPFATRNLFDFWAHWHMTLSNWFKTYLFNPLMKGLASSVTEPRWLNALGVLAFFVTFFVMGVWHGSTAVFVIYGLVMGAGVSLNKVWQVTLTARLGKKRYRKLGDSFVYASVARGLTFTFFAFAVTGLWVNLDQLAMIGQRLGGAGAAFAFLGTTVCATVGGVVVDRAAQLLSRLAPPTDRTGGIGTSLAHAVLACQVVLIFAVGSFFHKAPEFVYKAF